eukprot:1160009-Pelagomonas_calceolata.AAC.7
MIETSLIHAHTTSSFLFTSPFAVSSSLSSARAPHVCWRSSVVESVCAPSFLPLSLCVRPVLASRLLHYVTGFIGVCLVQDIPAKLRQQELKEPSQLATSRS